MHRLLYYYMILLKLRLINITLIIMQKMICKSKTHALHAIDEVVLKYIIHFHKYSHLSFVYYMNFTIV